MKLLTSAAVSLFLISLAGVSYSQGSRTEYDSYEYEIAEDQMTWIEASAFAKSKVGTGFEGQKFFLQKSGRWVIA